MTTLPTTIYQHIAQHVSKPGDLCALSLVCQTFRYEAQRILFKEIHPFLDESRYHLVIPVLATSPWYSRQVRELYFVLHTIDLPDTMWDMLFIALRSMVNLERLAFTSGRIPKATLKKLYELLPQCTFRLRALYWGPGSGDNGLLTFLESQPGIRVLFLPGCNSLCVPAGFLPQLTHLAGCSHVTEAFLSGGTISWVYCTDQLPSFHHLSTAFVESLKHLEHFAYMGSNIASFHDLVPYFENLQRLTIFAHLMVDDFLKDLAQIPHLKQLYILLIRGFPRSPELIHKIFQNCTALEYLEIMFHEANVARVWYRGSTEPETRECESPPVMRVHFGLMGCFKQCDYRREGL